MSALAKRFPRAVKKVYCSHCKKEVHPRVRFQHLQEHMPKGSPNPTLGDKAEDERENDEDGMDVDEDVKVGNSNVGLGDLGGDEEMRLPINPDFGGGAYNSDSDHSDRSDFSRRSWYYAPTPSPPRVPSPENAESSDNEDGFLNIDPGDFREFEEWYAEDNDFEEAEMLSETLTDEEIDSIIMVAIRQFGTVTQSDYERIRYSYRQKLKLLSPQRLKTRLTQLSGVKPVNYDCCIEVCYAFTGEYAEATKCPGCGLSRYDPDGRPIQTFQYLPVAPRLQAMFNNPDVIRKMLYRAEFNHKDGQMNDIFDSEIYQQLLGKNIIIDGVNTGTQYFSGRNDIATAVMTDGVELFDRASKSKSSCWPIMMQNLNLSPAHRAQLRNLIPLGVIPGPNKAKDFNSFLFPFVEECIQLAKGVKTFNVLSGRHFNLRMHPLIVSGDMQAMKYVMNFKGPNARVPCRGCLTVGIHHGARQTYYIPLAEPLPNDGSSSAVKTYDPRNLPLCTEEQTITQTRKIDHATSAKRIEDLTKKYGVCGPCILDRVPSLQRPSSYPHEFMHLFLLNHGPDLISIWIGTHSASDGTRLISAADWILIGIETEDATYLLPAAFIRALPNIATGWSLYTAESWSFWLMYIGPVVLRGRLPEKYYDHYMEFVAILKCLLMMENTVARIEELKEDIVHYIEGFEELYYQYDYERLGVCKLVVHALLHVAEDVLRCGPVWVSWSFSIERYCRAIVGCAKSKVVPYATINQHVLQMAQLAAIASRFSVIRKAMLFGKASAPVEASRMEHIYEEYPEVVLRHPRLRGFPLNDHVRRRIAAYFHTNFPEHTFYAWLDFIPERCERWGKLRIPDGGDSIRCSAAVNPFSPYGKRDSSYVQYEFQKDANENYPRRPIRMVDAFGYGRLDFILALTLPANKDFGLEDPKLYLLAHITEAKGAEGNAATELVSYTESGRSVILDVTSVKKLVGRVRTEGTIRSGEWYIIDRSLDICETVFHPPEHEHDGN